MRQIEVTLTRDKVAAELRHAILYGDFAPFEELNQDKIAANLGVSKMPVREAIQLLSVEGLVTVRPNRAPIVNEISDDYIRDHFDIRSLLEQEAVGRAATRGNACVELRQLHQKADAAIALDDFQAFNYYNGQIHHQIWYLSGNMKLEQILSQMWNTMHIDSFAKENAQISNREHGELINCIINREPQFARSIMRTHVEKSYEMILRLNKARMEKQKNR